MPLPTATGNRFDTTYAENTMGAAPSRTARASLYRLKYRYRNVDLEAAARSMCAYLRSHGSRNNFIDKYRVAERAIFPGFGAAGANQWIYNGEIFPSTLEAAVYFWIAACDDSPAVNAVSESADRKENFVRALYEAQRGNNNGERTASGATLLNSARINYVDDGAATDRPICSKGTLNKICEYFVGCHPDVELIAELNGRVLYLLKGFLANKCLDLGYTIDQLAEGTVDLATLTPEEREEVKQKVIAALGGLYSAENNLGLVGTPELRYIDESLSPGVIEYFDFSIERANGDHSPVTPAEVLNLIRDANEQLARATLVQTVTTNRTAERVFPFDRISGIITSLYPRPANTTQHVWENNLGLNAPLRNMNDFFGWNHNRLQADYDRYYMQREREREAAMQPQPLTISADTCAKVREDRHQHRGMRPKA